MKPFIGLIACLFAYACSSGTTIVDPAPRQGAQRGADQDDAGRVTIEDDGNDSKNRWGVEDDGDEKEPDDKEFPPPPDQDQRRLSQGTGGRTGAFEEPYTDTTGLESTYKINAPTDVATKIYGLHIHLHGDGGGGYRDFPNEITKFELIGVTVKAPNRNLQWGRSQGREHARYLNDLIQNDLIKKYNVDLDKIYFSGVSGGAYFLTGSFIPEYGHNYKSGAFIMCGGEAPRVQFTQPDTARHFRVYWQVTAGERQDIRNNINQSTQAYTNALNQYLSQNPEPGLDIKTVQDIEIEGNGGHCEYDGFGYTQGIQSMLNRKFEVVLKK